MNGLFFASSQSTLHAGARQPATLVSEVILPFMLSVATAQSKHERPAFITRVTGHLDRLALPGRSVSLLFMSDADVAEILKLPTEDKLRLMELLWESLSASPSEVPLGDAHRACNAHEVSLP